MRLHQCSVAPGGVLGGVRARPGDGTVLGIKGGVRLHQCRTAPGGVLSYARANKHSAMYRRVSASASVLGGAGRCVGRLAERRQAGFTKGYEAPSALRECSRQGV